MSNPNQITVKTNVRKLGDDESLVQDSFLFCQSTVDSTRAIKGHYTCYLTSKEERIVHKTVLDHLLGGFNEISLKHPSKDTTIIEPPLNYDVDTTDTQHDILVTIYEGAGKPPALSNGTSHKATSANTLESSESEVILPLGLIEHTSDFIRSWSPIDAGSPLHRRWIKIEIVVSPGGDWSQITKSLNHDDGEANHGRVMYVPIKVIRRFISRHQITQCGNDAATNFEISKATNIPLSSIEKVAGLNLGKTEYHRYYAEDTFAGTNLVTGSQRRYRTGTGDSLYFVEKPWAALMFASKPYTLAEVVIERHPHQVDFLRTHDGVSMLSKEFRGVKVSVRVGKQSETRTITAFRESRVGDAPIMLRHYAWAMKGDIVTLADLPCVDVGTLAKPLLLPLELCSIQPMQRLRGPVEAPLSRAAEHYRLSKQTRADDVETTQAHIAVHAPMSALRRGEHVDQKVVQACGLVFPNLLYVEAGSAKIGSRNWVALQTSLRDLIKKSFDTSVSQRYIAQPPTVPTSKDPLLRLQYDSDDNLSSRWAEQLRLFEKDHRGDANQRTFMIVCLPAERDHAKMYEVIKKACDLTTDIQTFFINFSALECRVREDPISGISRIAGDIRRRMRLRNPPSLADAVASRPKGNGAEDEFLTIAMHVSRVTTPTRDCIDPSHATEVYLCALVAANPKTGTCYNTELKLCTKADLDNVEMHVRLMFEPLVGELSFKDWRRVIILRSGYFPQRQPWLEISAASAGQSRPVFTRPDTRTDEFTSICTIFDRKSRPRNITYITLQEDKVLKLRIEPGDIKPAVSGQTELPALLLTKNTGNLGTELQSIRVTNVHSKDDSTGVIIASIINPPTTVTRIGTRNELWAAASSSFPTVKGKSLQPGTTTFGRGGSTGFRGSPARGSIPWDSPGTAGRATPLHDDTPTKSSRRGDTPSTPVTRAPSTVDEGNAETTTELGDAAAELGPQLDSLDLDDTKKKPENALTQAEVEMMVELWDGRDVGLVGTKWPVLTHLAHLATKRALLHLDRTDWEGTTGEGDTTPLFLPPVHKNVRNSLYYL